MAHCDICNRTFQSASYLETHYRIHTNERPFACNVCSKTFRQRGHLNDHLKLHGEDRSYTCKVCGESFKQSSGLRNHRFRFHKSSIPSKTKVKPRKPKRDTMRNAAVNAMTKLSLEEQPVDVETGSLHKCNICNELFLSETKLDNHIAWHTRRKRFKCMVCSRIFKHLSIFKKHQMLHKKCQKESNNNRTQHTIISDVQRQQPSTIKVVMAKKGEAFCEECQKTFSCKFSYQRHIREYHQGAKRTRRFRKKGITKVTKFKCCTCQKLFSNISSLRVHRGRVHPLKTHKCQICGKSYGVIFDLRNHYKTHDLHLLYKCDICEKPFQYQAELKEHYTVHTKQMQEQGISSLQGQHVCDICGRHFQYRSRLRDHMFTHQNQASLSDIEWTYQCTVCQRLFRYPSQLQAHYKTHTNKIEGNSLSGPQSKSQQANHLCNICGKVFPFRSHLKRHVTTHYKPHEPARSKTSSKIPYECDFCGRMFRFPSQLREHLVVHSEEEETLNSRPYSKQSNCKAEKQEVVKHQPKQEENHQPKQEESHQPKQEENPPPKQEDTDVTPQSGSHKCDICGNTFQHKTFLAKHYVVHETDSEKRPYSCAYCDRSFWQTNHLKKHCQGQHNTDNPFKCERCSVTFSKKIDLRDHLVTCVGAQPIKNSSKNEISAKGELQHVRRRAGRPRKKPKLSSENGMFKCTNQGKKKRVGGGLKKTHGTQTTSDLKYTENGADDSDMTQYTLIKKMGHTCNICGAIFASPSGLRMHLDIHYDRRPFSCRFCDMKFRQLGHLSSHCKTIHHEEFPYQCELCNVPFKGAATFKNHQQMAHGLTDELDGVDEKTAHSRYNSIDFEPKNYTIVKHAGQTEYACGFCDASARTFKSLSGLRRHITIVHTSKANQTVYDKNDNYPMVTVSRENEAIPREESQVKLDHAEEIYKCNVCSVIVHGWEALEAHEKAHAKRNVSSPSSSAPVLVDFTPPTPSIKQTFECKFCGEEFDGMSREAFDQHQLEHELAAEEPMGMGYICGECDQEFAMVNDLIKHHEEAH